MNFGPLEFAAYLRRLDASSQEPAAVKAARAAAPSPRPHGNRLTIVSGPRTLPRIARPVQREAVSVYEAVAMRLPCAPCADGPLCVLVRPAPRAIVLVLSSHQ